MRHYWTFLCAAALAAPAGANEHATSQHNSDLPSWMIPGVSRVEYNLTRFVNNTSRSIDQFFGTEDSLFVENNSFLRIGQESSFRGNGDDASDTSVRFRLDLPTTRKRLRVLIENDVDDAFQNRPQTGTDGLRRDPNERLGRDTFLGLEQRAAGDGHDRWDSRFGAGVRFRSGIDPYLRYTALRQWDFDDSVWQINAFNRVTYFDKKGLEYRGTLDFARPLENNRGLRFLSQAEWREDRGSTIFLQSAEINEILSSRSLLRYALIAVSDTARSPNFYDYVAQVYYRRDIHRKFIYLDLVPELHFPQEAGEKPYAAFTVRLEMFFRGEIAPF